MGARLSALRNPVTLAVGALAVHRLTRLITEDTLTGPLRVRVARWRGSTAADPSTAETFIHCPWCVSYHVAALLYFTRGLPGWDALVIVSAWSTVAGIIAERT